jgi:hypothetical protein
MSSCAFPERRDEGPGHERDPWGPAAEYAARREIEDTLDRYGWPWSPQLSMLIDQLVILAESPRA